MSDRGREPGLGEKTLDQRWRNRIAPEAPDIAPPAQQLLELTGEGLVEGRRLTHAGPAVAMAWKNEPVTSPRRLPAGAGGEPCGSVTTAKGGSSPCATMLA